MSTSTGPSVDQYRHELLTEARTLAANARRLTRWRAVVTWIAFVFVVGLALVLVDGFLRREELGLRVLSASILALGAGYTAYCWFVPAWRFSPSPFDVAKWVEDRCPEYDAQLSTLVELAELDANETRFGSRHFRESAIAQGRELGIRPDWGEFLNRQPWRMAVASLILVLGSIVLCIVIWPQSSALGLRRLVLPLSAAPWPRQDQLRFVDPPTAVAVGSQIQLEVIDQQMPFPESIEVELRLAQDFDSGRTTLIPAKQVGEVAIANLPPIDEGIRVRATGGDDVSMPWHTIDVVVPPDIQKYQFSISPPAYSRRTQRDLVGKRIQVLSGTRVRLDGQLSEPVASIDLDFISSTDPSSTSDGSAATLRARLAADQRSFSVSSNDQDWIASQSLGWQFVVTTKDQLRITLGDVWAVEVVQDAPPDVLLQEPPLYEMSAQAELQLKGRASDDIGLAEIALVAEPVQSPVPAGALNVDSETPDNIDTNQLNSSIEESSSSIRRKIWQREVNEAAPLREMTIDHLWKLAADLDLQAGTQVAIWLEARDTLGQIGRSQKQTYRIAEVENLLYAMQDMQRQLLGRIRNLADSQQHNQQLATRTREIAAESGQIEQQTVDALSSVAQIQSSLSKQLNSGYTSILEDLKSLRQLLIQNDLAESNQAIELGEVERALQDIARDSMPTAVRAAWEAHQGSRELLATDNTSADSVVPLMDASATAQSELAERLQTVLDQMSRSEFAQEIQRELVDVLNQQKRLRGEGDDLALQELTNSADSTLERTRLGLSADQQGLARRLDGMVIRMRETTSQNRDSSNLEAIQRAADALIERKTSFLMRRSAEETLEKDYSRAAATQVEVIETIQDALAQLGVGGASAGSLTQQAEQLRASSETISALAGRQSNIAEALENGVADPQETEAEQSQIRRETSDEADRMKSMGDQRSTELLEQATSSQQEVEAALASGQDNAAANSAREAAEDLQAAADQLMQRSNQVEREARQQQAFQLAQALEDLIEDQTAVVEQLDRVQINADQGLDELQQNVVREAAAAQEATRQTLRDVREKTNKLPAFDWTLEQTETDMSRSVAAAQRFRIDPEARSAARAALRKLELASEAIAETESSEPESTDEGDASSNQDEQQQRLVPPLASLKLLRGLQNDINEQTKTIDALRITESRRTTMLDQLSTQQKALGQQLERLLLEVSAASDTNQ